MGMIIGVVKKVAEYFCSGSGGANKNTNSSSVIQTPTINIINREPSSEIKHRIENVLKEMERAQSPRARQSPSSLQKLKKSPVASMRHIRVSSFK
jgi:hypothetical protein